MNTTTTTPTPIGDMLLSPKGVEILHQGIRDALIEEAMQWTEWRASLPVWMALVGAANRMGIQMTRDDFRAEQIKRSATPSKAHQGAAHGPL